MSRAGLAWLGLCGPVLAVACGTALARPAIYGCTETQQLKVDFTPRKAQLYLDDKQFTLQRIKTAHDAHYVNRKAHVKLVARKGDLTLHAGGRTQRCKLQVTP